MGARCFTDLEVELLATPQSVRVADAVAARDASGLEHVVRLMERECTATFGDRWTLALQSRLLELGGDDTHDAAAWWAARGSFEPFLRRCAGQTLRERIELLVRRFRSSGSTFTVEQDADRVRFRLDPWGSARLWRDPMPWQASAPVQRDGHRLRYPCSAAHTGSDAAPMLRGARPLTGQADELPPFLATEILFLELIATEVLGAPLAVVGLPASADDVATVDVYRRAADVPNAVFARMGLERGRDAAPPPDADTVFGDDELRSWETPLSVQVEEAGRRNDWSELDRLSALMDRELVEVKDPLANFRTGLLTFIAREYGEPMIEEVFDRSATFVMKPWLDTVDMSDPRVSIATWGVAFRAHGSTFDAFEEDDCLVFRGTLGACGRMWAPPSGPLPVRVGRRVRYPTFGVYDPPLSYHLLESTAPMTHGHTGHPIYSAHCHVFHELYPMSVLGRPLFLEFHPDHGGGDIEHVHTTGSGRFPDADLRRAGYLGR